MESQKKELPKTSFNHFVFHQERKFLRIAITLSVLQFFVFKLLYPYANFMDDSLNYIDAATRNLDINYWPIGYSKFLRLLHFFSSSDLTLVIFQYCILQGALLYLLFTILYFLKPGKFIKRSLLIFFCINPAFLSISNYVISDGIFTSLSVIWFTQLLLITFKPSKTLVIVHSFLLFILFTIRYNALYYPLISGFAVLKSTMGWQMKIISQGIAATLIGMFVWKTSTHYKTITGTRQFSPFGGWMLANNALIMYRNLPMNEGINMPRNLERLHQITTRELDSIKYVVIRPDTMIQTYYMWRSTSPLNKFLVEKYRTDKSTPDFNRWASVGPLYGQYGKKLIEKYPFEFVKYFIWENALWYFAPPTEYLGTYNLGKDTVPQLVANWFNYKSTEVKAAGIEIKLVTLYTTFLSVVNLVCLTLLTWMIFSQGEIVLTTELNKALKLVIIVWLFNIVFSLVAAPVVLRYQLFIMVLLFSFGGILIEVLLRDRKDPHRENTKNKADDLTGLSLGNQTTIQKI